MRGAREGPRQKRISFRGQMTPPSLMGATWLERLQVGRSTPTTLCLPSALASLCAIRTLPITFDCKRALGRDQRDFNTANRSTAFTHRLIRAVPESVSMWRLES